MAKTTQGNFAPDGLPAVRGARVGPRGFTLMEVLVALAVLSVMLMALHQAFGSNIFITSFTGKLWRAMVYTRNELLRVERSGPLPVSVRQGEFEKDHPMHGYKWKREVVTDSPFPGVVVRKVTLELTWDEGGAARSYQAQVFISPN